MPGAGVNLATAWITVKPTMTGVQGAIAQQMAPAAAAADAHGKTVGKRFAGGFQRTLALGGGLLVAAGIGKWLGDATSALKEWEVINAQSGAAVKSTGGAANISAKQVHELAQSIESVTATQAESIQKGANMLLTFKNIRNEAGAGNDIFNQSTKSLVDMSRAMGTDPQTAAIQLGKALNDPVKGIAALSRVGIQFTDDQKSMIKSLVESGDTMGAQKIILGELQSQFGGSGAAYAETFAGKLYLLNDAVGDLGEQFMSALMPAFMALTAGATVFFTWMSENTGTVSIIAAALGVLAVAAIAYSVAQWAMNSAMLASPITWIVLAIVALVAGIVWVATQTTIFQDVWNGAMKVIGAVVSWLWGTVIQPVFNAIGAIFNWIWSNIIQPVINGIVMYVKIWGAIFSWLYTNAVKPAFDAVAAGFNWIWNSVIRPVVDFIKGAINTVGSTVRAVFSGIAGFIGDAFRAVVNVVRGPINGLISLINGVITRLNSVSVTIPDWVPGLGGKTFGIKLPHIPSLARGGIAMPVPGGQIVNVAEAGRPEAIVPLDRWDELTGGGGDQPPIQMTNHITTPPNEDPRVVARGLGREFAAQIAGVRK